MLYCNPCGTARNYPIHPKKVKGSCEVCHAYAGPCNFTDISYFSFDDINPEVYEIAGFEMKQIQGFPVNPRIDMIESGAPHRFIGEDKVIFFKPKSIVLANIATGERIEVSF